MGPLGAYRSPGRRFLRRWPIFRSRRYPAVAAVCGLWWIGQAACILLWRNVPTGWTWLYAAGRWGWAAAAILSAVPTAFLAVWQLASGFSIHGEQGSTPERRFPFQ